MPTTEEPEPTNLAKFFTLLSVPKTDAKPFCRAVHEEWANDISELLFYRAEKSPWFAAGSALKDFYRQVPEFLEANGIRVKKLARPKKGIPAEGKWQAYNLELKKDPLPPVRTLLLWKEGGSGLPYLRELSTALSQLGAQLYLDVCRLDADSVKVFLFTDADWVRVGEWLGTALRDRLFTPVGPVPEDYDERSAWQWRRWTGEDPGTRDQHHRIWSERMWKCCKLSKAFLEEHKATLDAVGEWETDGASNYLEIKWKRPAGVNQSWLPLDLSVSKESSHEEHIGCSVGRFDPTPEMMDLLKQFLANQKKHLAKARAVIETWDEKDPKWGTVEIRDFSGTPELSVAPQFSDDPDEEEANPTRCFFQPETNTWE